MKVTDAKWNAIVSGVSNGAGSKDNGDDIKSVMGTIGESNPPN